MVGCITTSSGFVAVGVDTTCLEVSFGSLMSIDSGVVCLIFGIFLLEVIAVGSAAYILAGGTSAVAMVSPGGNESLYSVCD